MAILLLAGVAISGIMSFTRGDIAYSLVLVWAYIGIAVKFPDVPLVAYTAWASVVLILALLLVANLRRPDRRQVVQAA